MKRTTYVWLALVFVSAPAFAADTKPAETAAAKQPANEATAEVTDAAAPEATKPLDAEATRLVEGVMAFYDKIEHMRVTFTQVVSQRTLRRTQKASGTIEFLKPGKMRWQYEKPEKVLYVSDGKTLWSHQPEDGLVYRTRIQGSRMYHALRFLFGMGDFREVFDVATGPGHGPETAFLHLTPKGGHQDYKQLDLLVDRKTFEIRESFLTDPVDNVTQYVFRGADYETPVDASRFDFTPPPGTTVQDL